MRDESMNLVSFTEARYAESMTELFAAMPDNFETYMDEKYHWDPEKPVNARHAGLVDAMKTPPRPDAASETALDAEYIDALYWNAQTFLELNIQLCRETFDRLKGRVSALLGLESSPFWDGELVNSRELREALTDRDRKRQNCEIYAKEKQHLIGNRVLHPTPRSPVIFVCFVIFVVVFEFVWVWYFLSGELGLTAAVNISLAAAIVVLLISGFFAWSLAITAKDVEDPVKRALGYLGIVLCVLIFLFGLGLLSAWRADSTNEGFGYIMDGYRSFTEVDVFVTALLNLGGVILLTHELGRFLWPYPLYHYGSRAKELANADNVVEQRKRELDEKLAVRKQEVSTQEARIRELIDEMHKLGKNADKFLRDGARQLNRQIMENRNSYLERNAELRTIDVYPAPEWYTNRADRLDVLTASIEKAIGETVAHIRSELGTTGSESGETGKREMEILLRKKVEEALAQINGAQAMIDEITEEDEAETVSRGASPEQILAR